MRTSWDAAVTQDRALYDCKTDLAIELAIRARIASDGFFAQIEITFDATPCVVSNTSITQQAVDVVTLRLNEAQLEKIQLGRDIAAIAVAITSALEPAKSIEL